MSATSVVAHSQNIGTCLFHSRETSVKALKVLDVLYDDQHERELVNRQLSLRSTRRSLTHAYPTTQCIDEIWLSPLVQSL
jgi:hypothetical protein